ncbi:hypothetical protein HNR60_001130 [Rhodopseudomonas rhenobacensis]|uniref:Uncharacterized protein n=1 Tax=Rhodopseudomonas rhenobacensis TaxID=87461 RepID=A0A7W8DY25_9BRAD|nr:hypothetical protein [Rhodopseudomonas rhenobacensis]MBB5046385.1 hypothetical protein [Rhodopseudomonas rhenobacensis]
MRIFYAIAMIALLAGPAAAQQTVPKYGEPDPDKTPAQIEADKRAERAYQKALGNVPAGAPTDPWGNVRSDAAPKPAAKPAKGAKPVNPTTSAGSAK